MSKLYEPPSKRFCSPSSSTEKSTPEYQHSAWKTLNTNINDRVNRVNESNLSIIISELFKNNISRGRGLLASAIIQAQIASPFYTPVYAALVSGINAKFPRIGELICKRLISSFRRTYILNKKEECFIATKFLAHLVNQNILHEIIALEILLLLLKNPTDDSVELFSGFLKECGQKLSQVSPRGLDYVFSTLTNLHNESSLSERQQNMIKILFVVRKDQFKSHPAIQSGLDLVDENDQYTHMLQLEDSCEPETMIDEFKYDEQYEVNENKYKEIQKRILDEEGDGKKDDDDQESQQQTRIDQTETNLVTLRDKIYSTIQSSVSAKECAHKIRKMKLYSGHEMELCQIILDISSEKITYEWFFGILGQHVCLLKKEYIECFEKIFHDQYQIIHRFENSKLKNLAQFFAHLLTSDSISWGILQCIRLTEEDTTSSSRMFIKRLFLQLSQFLGTKKLKKRLTDPTIIEYFQGIFPRDNPKNTTFSLMFFIEIGLGELTDLLMDFIKSNPTPAPLPPISTSLVFDSISNNNWQTEGLYVRIKIANDDESIHVGMIGIILSLSNGVCTVHFPQQDHSGVVPLEHMEPVVPTPKDKIYVIGGDSRGASGYLLSTYNQSGVVQFGENISFDSTKSIINLKHLCKYT